MSNTDIRMKTEKYTINGKEYILRCNMNVLAEVQAANNGKMVLLMEQDHVSMASVLLFAAAMLNDYADEQGWDERFTAKSLGRITSVDEGMELMDAIKKLLYSAVGQDEESDAPDDDNQEAPEGEPEKNAETSQSQE